MFIINEKKLKRGFVGEYLFGMYMGLDLIFSIIEKEWLSCKYSGNYDLWLERLNIL